MKTTFALWLLCYIFIFAQTAETLTLDRIYASKDFSLDYFGPAKWMENGEAYTTLERTENGQEIIRYHASSGKRSVLVSAKDLTPKGYTRSLEITDYEWSEDKTKLLLFTNTRRVWRYHTRGDYWVLDIPTKQLYQIGKAKEATYLMFAKFSPNGSRVAYVYKNNIYVEDYRNETTIQLTNDGNTYIVNGTSDWVYEEEFGLRDGFRWSPDGLKIAYWQFDTKGIGTFNMINNTDSIYPKLIPLQYPKVGTTNSAVRVGTISSEGGKTTWFKLEGDPRNMYVPRMDWAVSSDEVIIQQMNRLQNTNWVHIGNAKTGNTTRIFTDKDDAWVEVCDDLKWFNKGKSFTWISEKDGWKSLYLISRDGKQVKHITKEPFDIVEIKNIDQKTGWVYFIASPDDAKRRYLYRKNIYKPNQNAEKISPDIKGTHNYQVSPTGAFAFHTFQSVSQPPIVSLVNLPEHKTHKTFITNNKAKSNFDRLNIHPTEFFQVKSGEHTFDAWEIKPTGFDEDKTYPVLFFVYGEPAGQTVRDLWYRNRQLWHHYLAQKGYVIISIDNRGTPAPKGRAWRKSIYGKIGIIASEDQAAVAKEIFKQKPYIDTKRVGIWGWSGGGSMTLNMLFRYPEIYKTGIAIAFVSDQKLYDTIYQERYMGLPTTNPEGYKNGSPITFAHQLKGNLLIIHGTGDDNVHYQSFEKLVNKLVEHNKIVSMLTYPNRSHGIYEGENTTRHLFQSMTHYLERNLK